VQPWPVWPQAGGGAWQVLLVQTSDWLQHGVDVEQLCPVWAHPPLVPQVPDVAPGGMLQTVPAQQSPFAVQAPPAFTQGVLQVPASQRFEQHCALSVQLPPTAVQPAHLFVVGSHRPVQHAASVVQASPGFNVHPVGGLVARQR
jgi:hypothetical protein